MTVLPGMVVYVPRQEWHGLRNTGTGLLQITWISAPPGIEAFFRELARVSNPHDQTALQTLAQRYGIEFRFDSAPSNASSPPSRHRRHRRHHGGKGRPLERQRDVTAQAQSLGAIPTSPVSTQVASPLSGQEKPHARRRQGRRHQGRFQAGHAAAVPPPTASATGSPRSSAQTEKTDQPRSPALPRAQAASHRRRGHIKEVYMGGRWVHVTGEGPVIAPGKDQSQHGRKRTGRGQEPPTGPLSVPL